MLRRWRGLALAGVLVVGCQKGPTTTGANDVRFGLSAQVSGASSAVLHVIVSYLLDSAQVATPPLVNTRINAGTGTAQVPLTIDLTPCLDDPRRAGDSPSCQLTVTVTLEQNGTVVDSVTIPTITATPGQTVNASTSVQPIGTVHVGPTSATIAAGGTVKLVDTVFSPTNVIVTGVAVTWTSANALVARVDTSGLVTGVGAGTTAITVTAGNAHTSATIVVTAPVSGGLALSVPLVQFSAPAGSGIPANATTAVTSTDTGQVSGLTATIAYGPGATGWLLANVSDSSFAAPSVAHRRIRAQATSNVTTPGTLDVVPNTTNLNAGTYTATVTVAGSGGQSVQLPVSYIISSAAAQNPLVLTPDTVTFDEYGGGANMPVAATIHGTQTGLTVTNYSYFGLATAWLNAAVTGTDSFTVNPNTTNLPLGTLQAIAHVQDLNGDTASLFVNLNVSATFIQLAAGGAFSCGLTGGNTVYCWGNNASGQLGVGSGGGPYAQPMPAAIPNAGVNGTPVEGITAGSDYACALMSGGTVYCWGYNVNGETGTGLIGDTLFTPVAISSFTAAQVSAGGLSTCAVASPTVAPYGGEQYCWGVNNDGQFGTGSAGASQATPITNEQALVSVSTGYEHVCGVIDSNAPVVYCWGLNGNGQLGIDSTGTSYATPHAVGSFASVSAGGFHTCALTTNGAASCWGENAYGELGIGSVGADQIAPQAVAVGTLASIAAGYLHTCGITSGGTAYCWGYDSAGALGNGQITGKVGTPAAVSGGLLFSQIAPSVAGYHTCGLTTGNVAYCWGLNTFGQLGIASTQSSSVPVQVIGQPAPIGITPGGGARVVKRPPSVKSKVTAPRPARR